MAKLKKWQLMLASTAFLIGITFLAAVHEFGAFYRNALRVTVKNVGDMEFASVKIDVQGHSYELGRISPGREASADTQIEGESSVTVTVTDLSGVVMPFGPYGYFEPANIGDVVFTIKNNDLIAVRAATFPHGISELYSR